MPIYFHKEDVTLKLQQPAVLKKWVQTIIKKADKKQGDINFVFCSDKYLLQMNRQYLSHDYYTDIITFNQSEDNTTISGDIYISTDRVRDNAGKRPFEDELHRVMIHGILHLLGYNDKTSVQKKKMRSMENVYLKQLASS